MDWSILFQVLVNGLLIAGLYAVVSVGLTLVLGVMGIVNFAHGEMVMLGAYLAFWLFVRFGIDPFLATIPAGTVLFALGAILYLVLLRPVLKAPPLNQLLLTLGLSIFLQNAALLLWGADFRTVATGYSDMSLALGPVRMGLNRLLTFLVSLALTVGLLLMLYRTRVGRAMRAVSQNQVGSLLIGINADRTYLLAFGAATAMAGASGALVSTVMYTMPTVGLRLALKAFAIVIIGGLGNVTGALLGSAVLSLAESVVGTFVPQGPGWAEGISFILIMLVLILRPAGFAGVRRE